MASHPRGTGVLVRAAALFALVALACGAPLPGRSAGGPSPLGSAIAADDALQRDTAATPSRSDAKAAARKKARASQETAFGREGDPRKVSRVINIDMSDAMRYFPDHVSVKKGQTVRFHVRNAGRLPHAMVLGTMDDLKKHAALLKKNGDIDHDEPNVAHVEPGDSGRIVWHFTRSGEFYFGCLVPGHFDAGMIGTIVVRPK